LKPLKWFLFFILFNSCANHRPPTEVGGAAIAYDSIASGNISANAIKKVTAHEVCFEISLSLQGTTQQQATPRNWTVAWVDKKNQYRLLSLNQRDPASIPQGGLIILKSGEKQEWKNTFRTCGAKAEFDEVKGIVLSPKELPYENTRSLFLSW